MHVIVNPMCATKKCANPICTVYLQTCRMIQGLCAACYQKQQQLIQQANVLNTTPSNG